jgi:hypothetical protein
MRHGVDQLVEHGLGDVIPDIVDVLQGRIFRPLILPFSPANFDATSQISRVLRSGK